MSGAELVTAVPKTKEPTVEGQWTISASQIAMRSRCPFLFPVGSFLLREYDEYTDP